VLLWEQNFDLSIPEGDGFIGFMWEEFVFTGIALVPREAANKDEG